VPHIVAHGLSEHFSLGGGRRLAHGTEDPASAALEVPSQVVLEYMRLSVEVRM